MNKKLRDIFVLAILNAVFMIVGIILLFVLMIFSIASIPEVQSNPETYRDAYIAVIAVLSALGGSFCIVAGVLNLIASIFILVTDFQNPTINSDSVRLLWGLLSLIFIGFIGQLVFLAKAKGIYNSAPQPTPTTASESQ